MGLFSKAKDLAVKGAKAGYNKTKEVIEENDLDNLAGIAAKGAQLSNKAKGAVDATKDAYSNTAEGIKDKGFKQFATEKATDAVEAGTKKASELKDKALDAAEETAQTVKASSTATNAIAKQKENPETPVVVIATETDKKGNVTKFGSGVKVSSKALEIKGKEEQHAIKELAAELKNDLAENGAETTAEEVTASVKEQHGENTTVIIANIASLQH